MVQSMIQCDKSTVYPRRCLGRRVIVTCVCGLHRHWCLQPAHLLVVTCRIEGGFAFPFPVARSTPRLGVAVVDYQVSLRSETLRVSLGHPRCLRVVRQSTAGSGVSEGARGLEKTPRNSLERDSRPYRPAPARTQR